MSRRLGCQGIGHGSDTPHGRWPPHRCCSHFASGSLASIAGQQDQIRQYLPQFDKAAKLISPKVEGDRLILRLDEKDRGVSQVVAALNLATEPARDAARRSQSANNLKEIGLGMHNYLGAYKHFPPPASHGPDGKPLLSWRVQILPFIGQEKLYREFHLDEPWDSEHNRALIDKMPAVFRSPKSRAAEGLTNYVVPVGDGALYASMSDQPELKEIKDGVSFTIMTLEVDDRHAVPWNRPDDLSFDPADSKKGIGSIFKDGFHAGMCDGSVRFLRNTIDPATLKALVTRAGGEAVNANYL